MSEDTDAPQPQRPKLTIKNSPSPESEPFEMSNVVPEDLLEASNAARTEPAEMLERSYEDGIGKAFLFSVLAGAAFSIAGLNDQFALRLVGVAGPPLSVVLFAAWGFRKGLHKLADSRQRFADACYFIGFILTMWALIIGFLPAGVSDTMVIDSRAVLRHFGMALGATAVGLIARILVLQSRSASRVTMEADLERAALQVTVEARRITDMLASTAGEIQAQQRAAMRQQSADMQALVATLTDDLRRALAPALEEMPKSVALGSSNMTRALGELTGQIEQQTGTFATAGAEMRQAFGSASEGARSLAQLSNAGGEGLASLVTSLAQALAGGRHAANELSAAATKAQAATQTAQSEIDRLRQSLHDMAADLTTRVSGIASASQDVRATADTVAAEVADFRQRVDAALRSATETVERDLAGAATALERTIERFTAEVRTLDVDE